MNGRKGIVAKALSFGLSALVDNVRLFVMVLLEIVGVIIGFTILGFLYLRFVNVNEPFYLPLIFFGLILVVFGIGLYLGLNKITLALVDGRETSPQELFSCLRLAPRAVVAMVLFLVMVVAGLVLFVLPGIFIAIRFSLFPYFIIDRDAGAIESLNMSYKVTENHAGQWLVLCVVVSIITGTLKIVLSYFRYLSWLGPIFSIPFSALVYAYFYRALTRKQQ